MKRAAQLLATGQMRVSEVAAQVGADDLNSFRKVPARIQGVAL